MEEKSDKEVLVDLIYQLILFSGDHLATTSQGKNMAIQDILMAIHVRFFGRSLY